MYRLVRIFGKSSRYLVSGSHSITLDPNCNETDIDEDLKFDIVSLETEERSTITIQELYPLARANQFYMQYTTDFAVVISEFTDLDLQLSQHMKYIGVTDGFRLYDNYRKKALKSLTSEEQDKVESILKSGILDDMPQFNPSCEDAINLCSGYVLSKKMWNYERGDIVERRYFVLDNCSNIFSFMLGNRESLVNLSDNTLGLVRSIWDWGVIKEYRVLKFKYEPRILLELM